MTSGPDDKKQKKRMLYPCMQHSLFLFKAGTGMRDRRGLFDVKQSQLQPLYDHTGYIRSP